MALHWQVTALREVADASPRPRVPQSPFICLRPSRAIHKCVPHRAGDLLRKPVRPRSFTQGRTLGLATEGRAMMSVSLLDN
jgi:hypothetical protein